MMEENGRNRAERSPGQSHPRLGQGLLLVALAAWALAMILPSAARAALAYDRMEAELLRAEIRELRRNIAETEREPRKPILVK
jgi:hypothetical protein